LSSVGQLDRRRAPVGELDQIGVGSRLDEEGVLEVSCGAGVDEVDAGPEVGIDDAAVGWEAGLRPAVGSLEVADHCRRGILTARGDGVGADEVELHGPALARLLLRGEGNAAHGQATVEGRVADGVRGRLMGRRAIGLRAGKGERDAGVSEVDGRVPALEVIRDTGIFLTTVFDEVEGKLAQERTMVGDAFAAKVKADGTTLLYAGYIGGSRLDLGNGAPLRPTTMLTARG
jgi:hypothetical protein